MLSIFIILSFISYVICGPTDGYDVTQIHIAQGKTPETMMISWVTKGPANSQVSYGLDSQHLKTMITGYSTSYKYEYSQYGVYQSGIIHHVELSNLTASTVYYYQCGDFEIATTSGILMFQTLPAVGDHRPLHFGVIGDLGQTTDSQSTVEHVIDNRLLNLILHAGDLSYADCNQQLWDSYGVLIEDLAKERPWMVGPGNHEIELNSAGSMFLAFEERYKMPAIQPAEIGAITIPPGIDSSGNPYCASSVFQAEYNYGNSFYSFDVGSAHVIFLNPYSVTNETSVQYQWLIKDLASVNRLITPWIIAVMHCPWYNSNVAHYNEEQAILMRNAMEPVLFKYHVNLVFGGHVHAYERTHPVFLNETIDNGIVYVTIGDGGNREGHANGYYAQPDWSAYRNGTQYGHGELQLHNRDKLTWKWFRNVDGEFINMDEVTICNTMFHKTVNDC